MILNLKIKNFRSIKDEVTFSMVAESSRSKENNMFVQPLAKGEDEVRLLKSAVLYGANGSGKSNVIRAVHDVIKFITGHSLDANEPIVECQPFLFANESIIEPSEFVIDFIGNDNIKYKYAIQYNHFDIVKETLNYYPNKKAQNIFSREINKNPESISHFAILGASFGGKRIDIFRNRTIISIFGREIPNEIISNVFIYLKTINIINSLNSDMLRNAKIQVSELVSNSTSFAEKINRLMNISDIGIQKISVEKVKESEFAFPDDYPLDKKKEILSAKPFRIYGIHHSYKNGILDAENMSGLVFEEESKGTQNLYALGGIMLYTLETGGILIVDEIETSFHPHLVRLLISMFHNPKINKKNAQLIFTTHDTNLMDCTLFRKDQVWFTEKNDKGVTELFSLQDFPEVREDTKFDKWYLAGKFGALPNLKSLEDLFE